MSPSHSPARSVTHSIRPQSPVPTDGAAEDGVGVDFRDGERNISRTAPKPPRDFGEYPPYVQRYKGHPLPRASACDDVRTCMLPAFHFKVNVSIYFIKA